MEEVQIENQDGDRDPLLILGKIEDMMLYAYTVFRNGWRKGHSRYSIWYREYSSLKSS